MKSFLLVLLTVVLALVVYWLARTGPSAAHDAAIALPRELEAAHLPSVELASSPDPTADAGARSRVTESSVPPAPVRQAKGSIDANTRGIGSVYGQALVRSARGSKAAVGKVSLQLEARDSDQWSALDQETMRPVGNLELGSNGEFEMGHLALGTWSAQCHVSGCKLAKAQVVLSPEKPRVRIDFDLEPQQVLRVTLHDVDGRPLIANLSRAGSRIGQFLGAFVSSTEPTVGEPPLANGGALISRTHIVGHGDADPWCEIELDSRAHYWVCVAIGDRTLAAREVQLGEEEVTLVASTDRVLSALGSVEVTVVDAWTSLALENASVSVRVGEVATDAQGRVRFDGLLPGELRIRAVAKEYAANSLTASISPGAVTRSEIRLDPSVTISGTLLGDADARKGGVLRIISLTGDRTRIHYTSPRSDGSFSISGLAHDEYVLFDSRTGILPSATAALDKKSLQEGMVYVDARTGSVSNVLVMSGRTDPKKPELQGAGK